VGIFLVAVGTAYVIAAFTAPSPILRIILRCLPVVPLAIWTLWFDRSRPFQQATPVIRVAGQLALLILIIAFAVAVLGIGLNWLDDPSRIL
jgi:hypothetical protein